MTVLEHDLGIPTETTDHRLLLGVGAAAVAFDLAVRSGVIGLSGSLLVVVVAFGLAGNGGLRNPQARAMVAMAPAFGVFLSLRASGWLTALNLATVAGLLVAGASFARGGTVLDVRPGAIARRVLDALDALLVAPRLVARALPRDAARSAGPVTRGLAIAVPVVVVLGAVLASGDAVFASLFRVPLDPSSWPGHLLLLGVGGWGMAGLLAVAASDPPETPSLVEGRLGRVEASMVLGGLVLLYAAFAVAQVVAASKGSAWVEERVGLTYAEYARRGFFQLLGVAVLTLVVLAALRTWTAPDRRVTGLALAAIGLTLIVVGVAVRRLHLYEQAFGLTVLRLVAVTFAVWVGAVFVLLALSWTGVGRGRSWLPAGAAAVGLALLFVLNVADPEALVVRRNLARPDFDPVYAATLSDDAVPVLLEGSPAAREAVCTRRALDRGWAGWNRAIGRAEAARRAHCP